MRKFVSLFDLHLGYQIRSGHRSPIHDAKALRVALEFIEDYKPEVIVLGGDMLDCGPISHHLEGKPWRTEKARIGEDATELNALLIDRINAMPWVKEKVYIIGNHEDWFTDLLDKNPALVGTISLKQLLHLDGWTVIDIDGHYNLGKLTFIHGHQLGSQEMCAKKAVVEWERNVRHGHVHTYQVYTKTSPMDVKLAKTGIAVPCLCTKKANFLEGKPNKWVQGFNHGVVFPDGSYMDYVTVITNGRAFANGKLYQAK